MHVTFKWSKKLAKLAKQTTFHVQHTFCTLLIFVVPATLLEYYLLSRTKTNDEEFIFLFMFGLEIFLTNLTAGELTFMLQSEWVGRVIALKFQMFK